MNTLPNCSIKTLTELCATFHCHHISTYNGHGSNILQYLVDAPARDGKKIKEKQIEKVKSRRNLTTQEIIVTHDQQKMHVVWIKEFTADHFKDVFPNH